MASSMGRSKRKDDVAVRSDAAPAGAVTGLGSDRGRFSENVESEIADVRGRMRSLRRVESVSSGSGDNSAAGDSGNGGVGVNGGSVGGKGVFQSFRESLFSRAPPELANVPATAQRRSIAGSGSASGSRMEGKEARERAIVSSTPDENRRKLRALMERVKLEMKPLQPEEALGGFEGVAAHCRVLSEALVGFEVKRMKELSAKIRGSGASGGGAEGGGSEGQVGAGILGEMIWQEEIVKALERSPALMEVREWRQTVTALRDEISQVMRQGVAPAAFGLEGSVPASAEGDDVGHIQPFTMWSRADETPGNLSPAAESRHGGAWISHAAARVPRREQHPNNPGARFFGTGRWDTGA